jgi:multisubunit Na+/H+ antiporter MnhG subunit
MTKSQIIGIGIIIIGIIAYLSVDHNIISTLSGVLCAIGLGFIFKWISFKKQNSTE